MRILTFESMNKFQFNDGIQTPKSGINRTEDQHSYH